MWCHGYFTNDFHELPSKHIVSHTILGTKISPELALFSWWCSFSPGGIFVIVPLDGISFFLLIPIMHPDLYPRCVAEAPPGGPCWKVCKTVNVNPGLITPPNKRRSRRSRRSSIDLKWPISPHLGLTTGQLFPGLNNQIMHSPSRRAIFANFKMGGICCIPLLTRGGNLHQ